MLLVLYIDPLNVAKVFSKRNHESKHDIIMQQLLHKPSISLSSVIYSYTQCVMIFHEVKWNII